MKERATKRPLATKINPRGVASVSQHQNPTALAGKVALRVALLPDEPVVRVLDAFAGDHDIWDCAKEVHEGKLEVLHVEKDPTHPTDLAVDNRRALLSLDLARFHLVDLDAWGSPDEQIEILAMRQYRGSITWTAITLGYGKHSGRLLEAAGLPRQWASVSTRLFKAVPFRDWWLGYLAKMGWTEALVAEPQPHHLYGAVGYGSWDAGRYADLYQRVLRSGAFARIMNL